jgi:hypothetical protein
MAQRAGGTDLASEAPPTARQGAAVMTSEAAAVDDGLVTSGRLSKAYGCVNGVPAS